MSTCLGHVIGFLQGFAGTNRLRVQEFRGCGVYARIRSLSSQRPQPYEALKP